jgi:hypothetical protein
MPGHDWAEEGLYPFVELVTAWDVVIQVAVGFGWVGLRISLVHLVALA